MIDARVLSSRLLFGYLCLLPIVILTFVDVRIVSMCVLSTVRWGLCRARFYVVLFFRLIFIVIRLPIVRTNIAPHYACNSGALRTTRFLLTIASCSS